MTNKLLYRRIAVVVIAACVVGLGTLMLSSRLLSTSRPSVPQIAKRAVLRISPERANFDTIQPGAIVKREYVLSNTGTEPLTLFGIHTSCGCTTGKLNKQVLKPGDTTALDVTFDSHGKADGPITKAIYVSSNAGVGTNVRVLLTGAVYLPKTAHRAAMMTVQGIFQGECARCHSDRGKGMKGLLLFQRDCALCHNPEHNPARSLLGTTYSRDSIPLLLTRVRDGIRGSNMPAFGVEHKGPLTEEQIESLAACLMSPASSGQGSAHPQ